MKKVLPILFICSSLIIFGGCSKYDDVKAYMNEVLDANEEYYTSLEKAGSSDDVLKAVEKLNGKLKGFVERSKKLVAKYPEIKGMNYGNHPKESDNEFKRQMDMIKLIQSSGPNLQKHIADIKVAKAMQEMMTFMQQLEIK